MEYDVVFIGHLSKDVIILHDGCETRRAGGAVYYGAIPAARIGARTAAVVRAAAEDGYLLDPMRSEGVTVFHVPSVETTAIENTYLDETMERRTCRKAGFAGKFGQEDLPEIESRVWHAAGLMRGETDHEFLSRLSGRGKVSADAQGFVRVARGIEMVYEDWPEKKEVLPLMSFFKCDAAEAEILTGLTDVRKAAGRLADWGAGEVVLTHPGGVLVLAGGEFTNEPFTPKEVRGRTGRGDTTMSSYLVWRREHGPAEACRFAATLCSMKMEKEGPFGGTLEEVLGRMKG